MTSVQNVIFQVAEGRYGVAVDSVREVLETRRIAKIPGAAPNVLGVINVRGMAVPIIDLRKKLYGVSVGATDSSEILVLEVGDFGHARSVGLLVDSVLGVELHDETAIDEVPWVMGDGRDSMVEGICKTAAGFTILLNANQMFAGENFGA